MVGLVELDWDGVVGLVGNGLVRLVWVVGKAWQSQMTEASIVQTGQLRSKTNQLAI